MKNFDFIKNYFEVLGITSRQSTRKDLLKRQNIVFFIIIGMNVLSSTAFGYYEANSFEEYVDSFYVTSSVFICFSAFGILLWDVPKLYRFINALESTINISKSK